MRLKSSKSAAEERLITQVNKGYQILADIKADYGEKAKTASFDSDVDNQRYEGLINTWLNETVRELDSIFPTPMEINYFTTQERRLAMSVIGVDKTWADLTDLLPKYIKRLSDVLSSHLERYTDLPIEERLYIEDLDSFQKARDINPSVVAPYLDEGYLNLAEDFVQLAFERILSVPFHKKDWGGEINDLYTANISLNGARIAAAFLLKGHGLKKKELTISDCGKNGDQILRLFQSPANLFVIQFVGRISEAVVSDALSKVRELRARNWSAFCLMIDGQDTARILAGYNELPPKLAA